MRAVRRTSVVSVLTVILLVSASPVVATEEEPATTDTTVAEDDGATPQNVDPPAVTVAPPISEEVPVDWTYRYLIPTLLVLAALAVIATTIQYFLQVVRKRYKVVE